MSGKPKYEIMTPEEMRTTETRAGRLYSQTADRGLVVAEIVNNLAAELAQKPRKIDLKDADLIRDIAVAYTDACARNGTLPSKSGLCRAMGVSRQAVDWFMLHHSDEPSAEVLRIIFDSFADALNAASLAAAVHPVVGIFLSKALYSYRDTVTLETPPAPHPLGQMKTAAEIAAKYKDLPGFDLPD